MYLFSGGHSVGVSTCTSSVGVTDNYYGTKLHNYIDSTFHVVIPISNHKDIT